MKADKSEGSFGQKPKHKPVTKVESSKSRQSGRLIKANIGFIKTGARIYIIFNSA